MSQKNTTRGRHPVTAISEAEATGRTAEILARHSTVSRVNGVDLDVGVVEQSMKRLESLPWDYQHPQRM